MFLWHGRRQRRKLKGDERANAKVSVAWGTLSIHKFNDRMAHHTFLTKVIFSPFNKIRPRAFFSLVRTFTSYASSRTKFMYSSNPTNFPSICVFTCSYNHILTTDFCCKKRNISCMGMVITFRPPPPPPPLEAILKQTCVFVLVAGVTIHTDIQYKTINPKYQLHPMVSFPCLVPCQFSITSVV